jgi:dGTPase
MCKTVDDVTSADENFVRLSQQAHEKLAELEKFLYRSMYKNSKIKEANPKIRRWLFELFEKLCDNPTLMPLYYQQLADKYGLQRGVCDYIAGMTDRYCLRRLNEIRE